MKIERLIDQQKARFNEFRDKWTGIGLSTEPANRMKAEAAIRKCYEIAGLPLPKRIVWCGSPLSQGFTRAIILDKGVWDSVRDSVWASVRDSVGDSVRDSVGDSVYGQHDASWLGFYDYFRQACGLEEETKKAIGLTELAQSAGWALPHQNICWISERHNMLALNEKGQLHSSNGPSVTYPDGWKIYALNGIRVPAELIETPKDKLDFRKWIAEPNVEIRREFIRLIGIETILPVLDPKTLDRSSWGPNPETEYELLSINMGPEVGQKRVLKMRNPSIGCWHVEGVEDDVETVEQAHNWRASGDKAKAWRPELLT